MISEAGPNGTAHYLTKITKVNFQNNDLTSVSSITVFSCWQVPKLIQIVMRSNISFLLRYHSIRSFAAARAEIGRDSDVVASLLCSPGSLPLDSLFCWLWGI